MCRGPFKLMVAFGFIVSAIGSASKADGVADRDFDPHPSPRSTQTDPPRPGETPIIATPSIENPHEYLAEPPPVVRPPFPSTSHGGIVSSGANCDHSAYERGEERVWLGHFTGGLTGSGGASGQRIEWKDVYACFQSKGACEGWQRDMTATFNGLEGYRSCQLIR